MIKDIRLEDELASAMAAELSKEIDFEIMSGILMETGWTKVVLKPMTGETSQEIDQWIVDTCKGKHITLGLVWVFENKQDANWFTMRWM